MANLKQDRTQKCVLQKQQKQWSNKTAESVFPSRQVCATCLLRIRIWMLPPPCHPTLPTVACSSLPGMWHATLPTLALLSASHLLSVISYLSPDGMIWQCVYQMGHVTLPTLACPSFPGIIMPPLSCHQLLLSWQCNNVVIWQCGNVACKSPLPSTRQSIAFL